MIETHHHHITFCSSGRLLYWPEYLQAHFLKQISIHVFLSRSSWSFLGVWITIKFITVSYTISEQRFSPTSSFLVNGSKISWIFMSFVPCCVFWAVFRRVRETSRSHFSLPPVAGRCRVVEVSVSCCRGSFSLACAPTHSMLEGIYITLELEQSWSSSGRFGVRVARVRACWYECCGRGLGYGALALYWGRGLVFRSYQPDEKKKKRKKSLWDKKQSKIYWYFSRALLHSKWKCRKMTCEKWNLVTTW